MSVWNLHVTAVGMLTISALASAASANQGIGPYQRMNYESNGTFEAGRTKDGGVIIYEEDITTINCKGCDRQLLAPGSLFHIKNSSKQPICVNFSFKPTSKSYRLETFGENVIVYIKGGSTIRQVGGLFYFNSGQRGEVDLGYELKLRTWQPIGKNQCGPGAPT